MRHGRHKQAAKAWRFTAREYIFSGNHSAGDKLIEHAMKLERK